MRIEGFSREWCNKIHNLVSRGHVVVKVNEEVSSFFSTQKGLGQGNPLSLILFNLVADILAVLITRSPDDGQLSDVVP
jgi:hypothetical protein